MNELEQQKILIYLENNPEFLQQHAKRLKLPTEHSKSKVKSFADVQLIAQQDKVENLELQLDEIYQIAEDNHQLIKKIIDFDHELMACRTLNQLFKIVENELSISFQLPINCIKLFPLTKGKKQIAEKWVIADKQLVSKISTLHKPLTGTKYLDPKLYVWLEDKNLFAESFLHLPLSVNNKVFGMILIGNENPDYFSENIPTDYVEIIAKSISISLNRILKIV